MLLSRKMMMRSLKVSFAFVALSTTLTSIASADLIAHWKLDETTGAGTAVDSTGNGHTGTKNGNAGSGAAGIIGNAWVFSGAAEDYISVDTAPGTLTGLGTTFTISGWVKTAATSNATMFSISDNTVGSEEVAFRAAADGIASNFGAADLLGRPTLPARTALTTSLLNDDQWHLLTFAQDSTGWDIYVDGVSENSGVTADGLASPFGIGANSVNIGANDDSKVGVEWNLNGLIDDLAVWDQRLTATEVANLYSMGLVGIDAGTAFTATNLKLQVSGTVGRGALLNNSGVDFDIDLYRIISPTNELANGNWNSLESQGIDGGVWSELSNTTEKISEGALGESTVFANGMTPIDLGEVFTGATQNLIFEYHVKGTPANVLNTGVVEYIIPGDMNGDGSISELDVNPFVLALTNRTAYEAQSYAVVFPEIIGDVNGDGSFDVGDFAMFKALVAGSGASTSAFSVPEPMSMVLIVVGAVGMMMLQSLRRRHSVFCSKGK